MGGALCALSGIRGRTRRAIIDVKVTRVSSSCGYGVPTFSNPEQRTALMQWAEKKGPDALSCYRRKNNAISIDGLTSFGFDDEKNA
jgi:hypothetical protein